MTTTFRNPFALLLLFFLAVGVLLISGPAQRLWSLDHDGGGMYPASDCGRNYWLNLFYVESGFGKDQCIPLTARRAEEIDRKAIDQMKKDGVEPFDDVDEAVAALQDYIGVLLEKIFYAW